MPRAVVTLVSKPGCHLCDDARLIVTDVVREFANVTLEEKSIIDDPELQERYLEEIPVVLINGKVHNIWRVDAARFRAALEGASE